MGRVDLRVSLDGAVRHSSSTGTLRKADKRTVSKTWTPSPLRDPDHPWWDEVGGEWCTLRKEGESGEVAMLVGH